MAESLSKAASFDNCRVRRDVPSNQLTTFGIGKGLLQLFEPDNVELLIQILPMLENFLVLGNGSNLVLPDSWISRPVIRLPKSISGPIGKESPLNELLSDFEGENYYAGTSLINLSRTFSLAGLSGLEFAAGIPGTLGGAIKMNAGAHGESVSQVITGVITVDSEGTLRVLGPSQLDFSYRHSSISSEMIVLAASINCKRGLTEEIRARRESCLEYRTKTQPLKMPSAGSVFRNPISPEKPLEAAAYYLERVGLKGYQMNGVGYSSMHSNWLVRLEDSASSEDVRNLIQLGQKRVFEEYGLNLTPEILLW
jgi:UDP-N-acetylmuramate dehydrogenase